MGFKGKAGLERISAVPSVCEGHDRAASMQGAQTKQGIIIDTVLTRSCVLQHSTNGHELQPLEAVGDGSLCSTYRTCVEEALCAFKTASVAFTKYN